MAIVASKHHITGIQCDFPGIADAVVQHARGVAQIKQPGGNNISGSQPQRIIQHRRRALSNRGRRLQPRIRPGDIQGSACNGELPVARQYARRFTTVCQRQMTAVQIGQRAAFSRELADGL